VVLIKVAIREIREIREFREFREFKEFRDNVVCASLNSLTSLTLSNPLQSSPTPAPNCSNVDAHVAMILGVMG
jgi:hypothetical protein